ncbi:MAG TPA: cyclopropane-fatty-acyl-phospholipid synthase family protein [Burkholderiales bacterium]|nr:cyclopropane-fatty-acyl-phospholipid synthase family protein [Burkholderiales bacterium]
MNREDPELFGVSPNEGDVGISRTDRAHDTPGQRSTRWVEGYIVRSLLGSLGNPPIRITLWTGESICTAASSPVVDIRIRSFSCLLKLLINPELYFGDAYSTGLIEVDGDLVKLMEVTYQGLARMRDSGLRLRLTKWLNRRHSNALADSRENIHHHYDIGNEFYKLWLDRQLVYTCAYFSSPDITLEQAQIAKMDHVCRKIRLRPEESVVEAGCGWGALALHMATQYGARVKAFNISHEQIAYARERAHALGVEHRVEFIEDDYRNASGRFDAFMSVGMLEHVGPEYYRELRHVIDRCLDRSGRGLIHSIGRNRPNPLNAWVEKRIFPGAYPPSLREMLEVVEDWDFSVLDVENLRLHYALTLKHWLQRFENASSLVKEMYDERFVRAWRLYLAGSIASFSNGDMQLFQVLFTRGTNNDIPWTRAYLYDR